MEEDLQWEQASRFGRILIKIGKIGQKNAGFIIIPGLLLICAIVGAGDILYKLWKNYKIHKEIINKFLRKQTNKTKKLIQ